MLKDAQLFYYKTPRDLVFKGRIFIEHVLSIAPAPDIDESKLILGRLCACACVCFIWYVCVCVCVCVRLRMRCACVCMFAMIKQFACSYFYLFFISVPHCMRVEVHGRTFLLAAEHKSDLQEWVAALCAARHAALVARQLVTIRFACVCVICVLVCVRVLCVCKNELALDCAY